jgi:1,2-diacylglycerol-3-alpha-glucose alpha-1,2-galactosyltransferase
VSFRVKVISESEFTVQGHGVHTAYVELTNALRKLPDVSVTVNHRGQADVTHIHTVGAYALVYLLFGSGKKVVTAHVVPDSFVGSLIGAKFWLPYAKIYLRWFYNRADMVLAVSEETRSDLQKLGVKKPIEIFHNVIDTNRYTRHDGDRKTARKTLDLPVNSPIVIGAGQVQPRKRIDSFVDAAKQLPQVTFVWVGGMPFKNVAAEHGKMQHMIDTAPSNVVFPGMLHLDKMREYYLASDIFMLRSDQETFGLVVVEAAAAGLPIVLRDIPDYNETFRNDSVMVPADEFAPAIQKLIDDKTYYEAMSRSALRIAERFDSVKGAKSLLELYKTL